MTERYVPGSTLNRTSSIVRAMDKIAALEADTPVSKSALDALIQAKELLLQAQALLAIDPIPSGGCNQGRMFHSYLHLTINDLSTRILFLEKSFPKEPLAEEDKHVRSMN